MNTFLENKVFFNFFFSKNFIKVGLSSSLIFFKEKKTWTNSADFWPRKITVQVQNWHFLSADFQVLVRDIWKGLKGHFSSVVQVVYRIFCGTWNSNLKRTLVHITLFNNENEWQKTKPVPIPLPRASRNFPDVKRRNNFFFLQLDIGDNLINPFW